MVVIMFSLLHYIKAVIHLFLLNNLKFMLQNTLATILDFSKTWTKIESLEVFSKPHIAQKPNIAELS